LRDWIGKYFILLMMVAKITANSVASSFGLCSWPFDDVHGNAVGGLRRLVLAKAEAVPLSKTDRALRDAHLSDDETIAKMGHPNFDVGHPPTRI
jgi:hypothetical protein